MLRLQGATFQDTSAVYLCFVCSLATRHCDMRLFASHCECQSWLHHNHCSTLTSQQSCLNGTGQMAGGTLLSMHLSV
jgi:hypothetical protein